MEEKNIDFLAELERLSQEEDLIKIGRELGELRTSFEDHILAKENKHQVAQLKAADEGEKIEDDSSIISEKEQFYNAYNALQSKRKDLIDERNQIEAENLKKKKALISEFKNIVADEENIGAAVKAHKEINEKWKSIGDIPRDKRHDVQQEYSRLLEEFFYNIRIYRDIKDYDRKKNLELKEEVIKNLIKLQKEDKIKEVESKLKKLQNDWEDIGPTSQEDWERIKEEYWTVVRSLYDKIRAFYDERREQMKENITLKKDLIAKAQNLLNQDRPSVKAWNKQTKTILSIQDDWKKIGFGPKAENDEVWKEFRAICDEFFNQKSAFFEDVQDEFDELADKKAKLIEKVESIKDSTDWKNTTQTIIKIQKQWKEIGNAGQKNEQKLWKKFRAACDHFFNAKDKYFKELDAEKEVNLKKKEELIKKIEEFKPPKDKNKALEQLKSFANEFAEIGFVPLKQKDKVYSAYKKALDEHYNALDLKGEEKAKIMFEAKLDTLKGSGDSESLLITEKNKIKKNIQDIEKNILQLENNLGFFANADDSHPLKKQALESIEKEKDKIKELKAKLKLIAKA